MGITSARGAAVRWFGHPAALRSGTSAYSAGISSEACDPVAREAAVVGGKLVSKPV